MKKFALSLLLLALVSVVVTGCAANSTADLAGKYGPLINTIEKVEKAAVSAVPAFEIAGALTPEQGDKILAAGLKVDDALAKARLALSAYVSISDSIASHNFLAAFAELQKLFLDLTNATLVAPVSGSASLDEQTDRAITAVEAWADVRGLPPRATVSR